MEEDQKEANGSCIINRKALMTERLYGALVFSVVLNIVLGYFVLTGKADSIKETVKMAEQERELTDLRFDLAKCQNRFQHLPKPPSAVDDCYHFHDWFMVVITFLIIIFPLALFSSALLSWCSSLKPGSMEE